MQQVLGVSTNDKKIGIDQMELSGIGIDKMELTPCLVDNLKFDPGDHEHALRIDGLREIRLIQSTNSLNRTQPPDVMSMVAVRE